MVLFAIFMCVNLASCSSDDVVENQEPQKITVSLDCVGEILDVTHEPLLRTARCNLYEISVYTEDGAKYAVGSFDAIDNLTIDLLDGKTYSFKVSYTLNYPNTPTNKFNYSVSSGSNALTPEYYRFFDVYYGAIDKYTPTINGNVEIYMKRMSFGLKLVANGLVDGASIRTELKRNYYDTTTEAPETLTYSSPECEKIYSFTENTWDKVYQGVLENGDYVNYYETASLQIFLTRTDGIEVDLGKYDILVERNKKICVNINIGESASMTSNGIVITQEEEEMSDGKQYEIDGEEGTITETPIITE